MRKYHATTPSMIIKPKCVVSVQKTKKGFVVLFFKIYDSWLSEKVKPYQICSDHRSQKLSFSLIPKNALNSNILFS